jgi:hypothetical protein
MPSQVEIGVPGSDLRWLGHPWSAGHRPLASH